MRKKSVGTTDREKGTVRGGKIQADKRTADLWRYSPGNIPLSARYPSIFHVKIKLDRAHRRPYRRYPARLASLALDATIN